MNHQPPAKYEAQARVVKALAHPARLLIVDHLAQHGPRCVCDLARLVGCDVSSVSRHLAQLRQAGIVNDQKQVQMVLCRLHTGCVSDFLGCVESVIRSNLDRQQALLERPELPEPSILVAKQPSELALADPGGDHS